MPKSKSGPDDDTISDLIEPVCMIADLKPNTAWPNDLCELIAAARNVKALYGFQVQSMSLLD